MGEIESNMMKSFTGRERRAASSSPPTTRMPPLVLGAPPVPAQAEECVHNEFAWEFAYLAKSQVNESWVFDNESWVFDCSSQVGRKVKNVKKSWELFFTGLLFGCSQTLKTHSKSFQLRQAPFFDICVIFCTFGVGGFWLHLS